MLILAILFAASFAAGIQNTVAGGGSFLTFPVLLLTGLDPRAANITSTIALFPMQVSTGYAGRKMAADTPHLSFKALFIISLLGGILGAGLLLLTPPAFFAHLVPWLILFATSLFAYGSFVKKPGTAETGHSLGRNGMILCQFLISIYGGYFGGGIGFLMLAALTLAGVAVRQAGASKNILAAAINAAAVAVFLFSHEIGWIQVAVSATGALLGGWVGVRILHRINERILRIAIVVIGLILSVAMFIY